MVNVQDRTGQQTIEQLRQRYDFDSILKTKKAVELQKDQINKVDNELTNFVLATTENINSLQSQVDGNITTWFFSGEPTLSNNPAVDWTTDELKNIHLGDLYYNKDTGYGYRFGLVDTIYQWIKITDNDVVEALAIANAAKDTADNKRRVFTDTPTPPYDNGDLYITNVIRICQISKPLGETYEVSDFIDSLKYTDDTKANEVDGKLTVVSGQVTEIKADVDIISQTVTDVDVLVNDTSTNLNNNYLSKEQIQAIVDGTTTDINLIKANYTSLTQTATNLQVQITSINTNGVSRLQNTLVLVNENGINLSKTGEEMTIKVGYFPVGGENRAGLQVNRDNEEILGVDNTGVRGDNFWAKKYLKVGDNSRFENYQDGTGCFFVG